MDRQKLKSAFTYAMLLGLPLTYTANVYAAKPINLRHQSPALLHSFVSTPSLSPSYRGVGMKEMKRSVDFNQTTHIRMQETYAGYPVWGADAVVHVPKGSAKVKSLADINGQSSMNGIIYQDLAADLGNSPAELFSQPQMEKVINFAVETYQKKAAPGAISNKKAKPIIFIDKTNKAHWAYQVSFAVEPAKESALPAKPVYILDAKTLEVYAQWDEIKTATKTVEVAGGYGGNFKMGKLSYDGTKDHLAALSVTRDDKTKLCFLQNDDVTVKHYKNSKVASFSCKKVDPDHGNIYWDGELDTVNNGYSPDNDALFGGLVIKNMYQAWYGVPVLLDDNGKPMMLTMVVHANMDNAYWDGSKMTFGDGISMFYPLTSLGVAAHEISHGFTEQHSNLAYYGQSGGMNEAFSDMAAQAAEWFAYGKNSWQIGPEIFKAENEALRYMDQPSKDCHGGQPGDWCSIDEMSQYNDGIDVHFSSGIYNRAYYLIGTAEGWNPAKAFDVMVQANRNYWTSGSTFAEGACGVLKAAVDYKYDTAAVVNAFNVVGIDTKDCA